MVGHGAAHPSRLMSKSPRKNLRRSLEALNDVLDVCEQHADARADLVRAIGVDGYTELHRVRAVLAALASRAQSDPA